ncbi:MAG: hypothetical protein ACF8GE_07315 [Phycisphaerales bacterium JB043]
MIVLIILSLLGVGFAVAGPLDPAPGPVQETGRTLVEIYDLVDDLQTNVITLGANTGPWEVLYVEPAGPSVSPELLVAGPVLLHAVIYYNTGVRIYNSSGTSAGQIANLRAAISGDGWYISNSTAEFDVVLENGLTVAWNSVAPGGSNATFLYRSLQP